MVNRSIYRVGVNWGMEKKLGVGKNKNTCKIEMDSWYEVK